VDLITTISAGSGDKGVQKGKVNKTMDKNSTVKDYLNECAKGMEGVEVGQMQGCSTKADKTHKTIVGNPKRAMDKIAKRANIDWWIELMTLKALKKNERFGGTTIANVENGMIGSPKENIKGVSVDMLLNPSVRIGTTLNIQSRDLNRNYKIISYSHRGSFYGSGSSWITSIVGEDEEKTNKESGS